MFWFVSQSHAQYSQIEQDALKLANEIQAEYWAVSSLTGERLDFTSKAVARLPPKGVRDEKYVYSFSQNSFWFLFTLFLRERRCSRLFAFTTKIFSCKVFSSRVTKFAP